MEDQRRTFLSLKIVLASIFRSTVVDLNLVMISSTLTGRDAALTLKPIENVWRCLKRRLKIRLGTSWLRLKELNGLIRAAQKGWEAIEQAKVDRLIDSMPVRVLKIKCRYGGHSGW